MRRHDDGLLRDPRGMGRLLAAPLAQSGFTLLEVLVAIAIVMILAAAVAPMVVSRLAEARMESVQEDFETLSDGIRRFYQDTGKLPPVLEALVSLGVPYDDDFTGGVDEDPANCVRPCDPPGIDPRNYVGWKGAYIQGGFDTKTNPAFSDAWGTNYGYCFVETGFDVNDNHVVDLICVSPTVNSNGTRRMDSWAIEAGFRLCPKQQAEVVIASYGKDRVSNAIMDGVNGGPPTPPNANPLPGGQVVFQDDTTYTKYSSTGGLDFTAAAEAYDAGGFLRLIFNDDDDFNTPPDGVPDGDCIKAETTGVGGVDEDDFGDTNGDGNEDDDFDGRDNEDPPYGLRGGDLYRTITIADLAQDKLALTTQRLDALEAAIKRFYRDTDRMPPLLDDLVSDVGATPGWNGPYVSGTLPLSTNPNLVDGWGTVFDYVYNSTDPQQGTLDFECTGPCANRDGVYHAVILSRGRDLLQDWSGDGLPAGTPLVISDDDGDGLDDEDQIVDGTDDDSDGDDGEDAPNTDQDAPDPLRLISIHDVITAKVARSHAMLNLLNDAASAYAPGYGSLDTAEPTPGSAPGAFSVLRTDGRIGLSYQNDLWNRPFFWDAPNDRFYSRGVDGCDGACPGGAIGTGDDVL